MFALLLAFAAFTPGSYEFRSVAEFQETSRAGGLDVVLPVIACARRRIEAHQVSVSEQGSADKAQEYATEELDACGLKDARLRLTATLGARLHIKEDEAERRAAAYLAFVRDAVIIKANQQFRVAPLTSEMSVEVPACPPKNKPQPKSCPKP